MTVQPAPLSIPLWQRLVLVAVLGIMLQSTVGLEPRWWLVWIAPAPLLALAYRSSASTARWSVALAALIGTSANFHYFTLVMPVPFAVLVVVLQALIWLLVVMLARRIVLHVGAWWTVFAYPLLWTAVDTLMAHLLPDGNWGSLGYSQSNFLPALQLVSVLGVGGLVFLLSLTASALSIPLSFGATLPRASRAYGVTALCLAGALAFGAARLAAPTASTETAVFGLAAIDDFIGPATPPSLAAAVWRQYDEHIAALARQGAHYVVLPEKIAVLPPEQAARLQQHLAAQARQGKVWIVAGIGIDDGKQRTNLAWLLAPDGTVADTYQKHHLAPPERAFLAGDKFSVRTIAGQRIGLAICKDMHFAAFGRAYGARGAGVMLVPAWDFNDDAAMASAITLTRGVESGYTIVRAAREGWLTVTDPYGRVLARANSAALPGKTLLFEAPVAHTPPTLYSRIGDCFGWLCVALSALSIAALLRKSTRRSPMESVLSTG